MAKQGRAAEVSRIELLPLQTVTVTEEQFLTGSRDGRPVTIAVELRFPSTGTARVPAVVLLHGSGGANTKDDRWVRELNDLGMATLIVDSFTGRGIINTVGDQSQLSELSGSSTRIVRSTCSPSTLGSTRHVSVFSAAPAARVDALRRRQTISADVCANGRGLAIYLSFTRRVPEPTSMMLTWWSDRFGCFTVRLTMLRLWRTASPT